MQHFLCPETLFGKKFEKYRNTKIKKKKVAEVFDPYKPRVGARQIKRPVAPETRSPEEKEKRMQLAREKALRLKNTQAMV